ncbi:MAG: RDD family protein [Actinomycetota bacterium]
MALPASGRAAPPDLVPSSELVTGEAVLLDLRPASFATRGLAWAIDATIQIGVLIGSWWLVGIAGLSLDEAAATAAMILFLVAVFVGVPVLVETLTRGRSAGKLTMGLRVVRDDGGPVRVRHAVVRHLVGFGEIWLTFGSPAVICSLIHPQGKRIGDLLAGTYVVRERSGTTSAPPVEMPPELAAWARAADIGRLPERVAMSARQFLSRLGGLHPESRRRLGESLAAEVARYVAPPPPPGTHPERMVAAVLAERRERDLRRLARERAMRDRQAERLHRLPFGLD